MMRPRLGEAQSSRESHISQSPVHNDSGDERGEQIHGTASKVIQISSNILQSPREGTCWHVDEGNRVTVVYSTQIVPSTSLLYDYGGKLSCVMSCR